VSARDLMPPREAAARIAGTLSRAGFVAYFAGGCVRDHVLGIEPADYDVATDATPEQIAGMFPSARGVGEAFGVMLVRMGGRTVEVATFRSEGGYMDGRRPSEVRFTNAKEDAQRRDFTINGLFQDPQTGAVIDHVGGQRDIEGRTLRAIGDPDARFREDRLRTLRAARFAARFALVVDPATAAAARRYAPDLAGVSRERVGQELRKMLAHHSRAEGLALVEAWLLDAPALGERHCEGPLARVRALPAGAAFAEALAAWKLDRASRPDAPTEGDWVEALVLSNREASDLDEAVRLVQWIRDSWDPAPKSARKRRASRSLFGAALAIRAAEDPAHAASIRVSVGDLASEPGGLAPAPFVTGDDLIGAGLAPGPRFKALLDHAYDRQLEGEFRSRSQALEAILRDDGRERVESPHAD
jgi:poly(A) polymerase